MRTIIHISDIHFCRFNTESLTPLLALFNEIDPDLIIISGDMTQRARVIEFEEARKFLKNLKNLGYIYFVVPGNHDIRPIYRPLSRIANPFTRYEKYISKNLEPVYTDHELAIVGLNTVRKATPVQGRVSEAQLKKAEKWFSQFGDEKIKIVVTHHPLISARLIWPRRVVAGKSKDMLHGLAKHKVDFYLSGHHHLSSSLYTAEKYKIENHSAIGVQAGTLSNRLRGELQSFNVLIINKPKATVKAYIWNPDDGHFRILSIKKFQYSNGEWKTLA